MPVRGLIALCHKSRYSVVAVESARMGECRFYLPMQIIICVDNQFVMSGVVEMWYTEFVNKMLQHCIKLHNRKTG